MAVIKSNDEGGAWGGNGFLELSIVEGSQGGNLEAGTEAEPTDEC